MGKETLSDQIEKGLSKLRRHEDRFSRIRNKWLSPAFLAEQIKKPGYLGSDVNNEKVSATNFCRAVTNKFSDIERFDGQNETGIFRVKCGCVPYYYRTFEKDQAKFPRVLDEAWENAVTVAEQSLKESLAKRGLDADEPERPHAETVDDDEETAVDGPTPASKRTRTDDSTETAGVTPDKPFAEWTFWDSEEASNLFLPLEEDADVAATLERRVKMLAQVQNRDDGWRSVVSTLR